MTARGFTFKPIDLYRSDATTFHDRRRLAHPAVLRDHRHRRERGTNIAAARDEGEFLSIEDFQMRSKASKTIVEILAQHGLLPRACRNQPAVLILEWTDRLDIGYCRLQVTCMLCRYCV